MASLERDFVRVARFVCNLRGSSRPVLVEGEDGFLYILKSITKAQETNVQFSDAAGTELFMACGLPVVPWKPLRITKGFLDHIPGCGIETSEGAFRTNSGLFFGSRFLTSGSGGRLLEILPGTHLKLIQNRISFWLAWILDICCEQAGNRKAIFQEDSIGQLETFFIDMGHLFSGAGKERLPDVLASQYLDPRVYVDVTTKEMFGLLKVVRTLDTDVLWRRLEILPADWKSATAIHGFSRSLDRIGNEGLLRNIVDIILDAQTRRARVDSTKLLKESKFRPAFLSSLKSTMPATSYLGKQNGNSN